jgi:hypothetical protein
VYWALASLVANTDRPKNSAIKMSRFIAKTPRMVANRSDVAWSRARTIHSDLDD